MAAQVTYNPIVQESVAVVQTLGMQIMVNLFLEGQLHVRMYSTASSDLFLRCAAGARLCYPLSPRVSMN